MHSASSPTQTQIFGISSILPLVRLPDGGLRSGELATLSGTALVTAQRGDLVTFSAENWARQVRCLVEGGATPSRAVDIAIKENPKGYEAWRITIEKKS